MNFKDQMELKPRIGRAMHPFCTKWYNSRAEVLEKLGLEHGNRPEIYANLRGWLKKARLTMTSKVIAEKTGMSVGMVDTDASKMGLTTASSSKYLLEPTKTTFNDDPYGMATKQFSYNKETGDIKWSGCWGRLSLSNIGKVVQREGSVIVKSRSLSYRQLLWLLHTGKMPRGGLALIDNDAPIVFKNLKEISTEKQPDQCDKAATREVVKVLGRDRVLMVDSSRPTQPQTDANKKRMTLFCHSDGMCRRYSRCMNLQFDCDCIGYVSPNRAVQR